MKIVVIGLGSMGKRRIRLMKEIFPEFSIYGVDGRVDRREEATSLFNIGCHESIDAFGSGISCAFVCTSPLSHAGIIKQCLLKKWHIFTELNLITTGYEENIRLAEENHCHLFLSSTFFYREEIKYIKAKVDNGQWNYVYHIGQYLPDWHPWENYNEFFVGDKRTNGCREIFAIELPWIVNTFGKVKDIHTSSDKMTSLKIGFDDNYIVQIKHENGCKGVLIVDVVSPCAVRKLEVYSEGKYIYWNGTPDSLMEYEPNEKKLKPVELFENHEHQDGYASFVVENAYKNEIREFFDVVMNAKTPLYGFVQDKRILGLIDRIGA